MNRGTKRVRIIVAFGDITEFGVYTHRVDNEETQSIPFLNRYDELVDELKKSIGQYLEDTGDGFIAIMEIAEDHASMEAIHFLKSLYKFYGRVNRLIRNIPSPRPAGYRIRVACGHALKKSTSRKPVYRGKNINLAHEMLAVEKNVSIICHETVKQLISDSQAKRAGIRFFQLKSPQPEMEGIYKNEMPFLWGLDVRSK